MSTTTPISSGPPGFTGNLTIVGEGTPTTDPAASSFKNRTLAAGSPPAPVLDAEARLLRQAEALYARFPFLKLASPSLPTAASIQPAASTNNPTNAPSVGGALTPNPANPPSVTGPEAQEQQQQQQQQQQREGKISKAPTTTESSTNGLFSRLRAKGSALMLAGALMAVAASGWLFAKRNNQETFGHGSGKPNVTQVLDRPKGNTNAVVTNKLETVRTNALTSAAGTNFAPANAQGASTNAAPAIPATTNAPSATLLGPVTNAAPAAATLDTDLSRIFGPLSFLTPPGRKTNGVTLSPPTLPANTNGPAITLLSTNTSLANGSIPTATNAPAATTPALQSDFSTWSDGQLKALALEYQQKVISLMQSGYSEGAALVETKAQAYKARIDFDALTKAAAERFGLKTPTGATQASPLRSDFSQMTDSELTKRAREYQKEALDAIANRKSEKDALFIAREYAKGKGDDIDALTAEVVKRKSLSAGKSTAQAAPTPTSKTDYPHKSTEELTQIITKYVTHAQRLVDQGMPAKEAEKAAEKLAEEDGHNFPALYAEFMNRNKAEGNAPPAPAPQNPTPSAPSASAPSSSVPSTGAQATMRGGSSYTPRTIPAPDPAKVAVTPKAERKSGAVKQMGSPRDMANNPERYKPRPPETNYVFSAKQAHLKEAQAVRESYIQTARGSGVNVQDSQAVWNKAVDLAAQDGIDLQATSVQIAIGQLQNGASARRALKTTDPMVPPDKGGLRYVGQKKFGNSWGAVLSEDGQVVVDQRRARFLGIPLPWKRTLVADGIDKQEAKALLASMRGDTPRSDRAGI